MNKVNKENNSDIREQILRLDEAPGLIKVGELDSDNEEIIMTDIIVDDIDKAIEIIEERNKIIVGEEKGRPIAITKYRDVHEKLQSWDNHNRMFE